MLAKTRFQHISGTRVAMDFVEVPSTLLEHFSSPRVLQQFKNEVYDENIDINVMNSAVVLNDGLDNMHQIEMAHIDQLYHSDTSFDKGKFDTTKILADVVNRYALIPHANGSRWQCGFTHLFTYGASYYSYAWSRLIADRIWESMFLKEEWRDGGEILQNELLSVGGGRDPWVCLEKMGILNEKELRSRTLGDS